MSARKVSPLEKARKMFDAERQTTVKLKKLNSQLARKIGELEAEMKELRIQNDLLIPKRDDAQKSRAHLFSQLAQLETMLEQKRAESKQQSSTYFLLREEMSGLQRNIDQLENDLERERKILSEERHQREIKEAVASELRDIIADAIDKS